MGQFFIKPQKGSAGVSALLFMLLLSVIGGAFVAITSTEVLTAANFRDGVAAQYLAEAGIQHALVKLKKDEDGFVSKTNTTTVGTVNTISSEIKNSASATAGSYKVTVTGSGTTRTITSIATVNKAKRQLIVTVKLGDTGLIPANLSKYAIFSDQGIDVNGQGYIQGPAGARGDIDLKGKGWIDPNDRFTNVLDASVPIFSGIDYTKNPLNINAYSLSGTYFVNGDLNLNTTLTTPQGQKTIIYVNGDVHITGQGDLNGKFLIIATGIIHLDSNKGSIQGIFISTSASESHINNGELNGSIFAHGPLAVGGTIIYNADLINSFIQGSSGGLSITSWNNK